MQSRNDVFMKTSRGLKMDQPSALTYVIDVMKDNASSEECKGRSHIDPDFHVIRPLCSLFSSFRKRSGRRHQHCCPQPSHIE